MGLHSCFVSHILCTKDPLFVLASPSYWIGVTEPRLSCCLDCLNLQEKRSLAGRTKKKEKKKNKLGCGPTLAQVFVYQGTSLLELVQRLSVWPPVLYLFCDTFLEFWQLDMVWRDATKLAQTWLSFLQCSQNSTVVCTVTVTEPQGQRDIANANADSQEADAADENAEIVEVLNDVEALLGEPIFITNWIREWRNEIFWIFHLQRCVYLIKFANIVTNYVNLSPPCL